MPEGAVTPLTIHEFAGNAAPPTVSAACPTAPHGLTVLIRFRTARLPCDSPNHAEQVARFQAGESAVGSGPGDR